MTTYSVTATRDTLLALKNGSVNLGAGQDDHNPFGYYTDTSGNSYVLASVIYFPISWTGMTSVTAARLRVRASSAHGTFGSDPRFYVARLTGSLFTEGTRGADEYWYGDNATVWDSGDSATNPRDHSTTGQTYVNTSGLSSGTWYEFDITETIRQIAPSSIAFPGGNGVGNSNYGLLIKPYSTSSTTYRAGFFSIQSGSEPVLEIDYLSQSGPTTTLTSPTDQARTSLTPRFQATLADAQNNTVTGYDIQVSTDSTFASVTHWNAVSITTGLDGVYPGQTIDVTYAPDGNVSGGGLTLTRNTRYYWRIRAKDAEYGYGAWSASRSVWINNLPTATPGDSLNGHVAHLVYTAGSGWNTPRLYLAWSYSSGEWELPEDPTVATESTVEVLDCGTNPGAAGTHVSGSPFTISGSATSLTVAVDLTEGNYYRWRVKSKDDIEYGNFSTDQVCRARWGMAKYRSADLGTVTSWSVAYNTSSITGSRSITLEYGSSATNAVDPPTSGWKAAFADVPKRTPATYFQWRAWLLAWGSATPGSPSLDDLTLTYTSESILADHWSRSSTTKCTIDTGDKVFGTQSARIDAVSGQRTYWYQLVPTEVGRTYILSGRIKSSGSSYARIAAVNKTYPSPTDELAATTPITGTLAWDRYYTAPFVATQDQTMVILECTSSATTDAIANFDGIKLESGGVASTWTPGFIGSVVVDAGGVMVDASGGGVLRLRGSGGTAADTVELGAKGLYLGGSPYVTPDESPSQNLLYNGGFRYGTSGWALSQNGDTTATFAMWDPTATDWTLRDGDIDDWVFNSTPYGSTARIMSSSSGSYQPFINSADIPVTAGSFYSVSALLGRHRATNAYLTIWWYDSTGTYLSSDSQTVYSATGNDKGGGPWLSGWETVRIDAMVAPATARSARVAIVLQTPYVSGTTCYLFIDQVVFARGRRAPAFQPRVTSRRPARQRVYGTSGSPHTWTMPSGLCHVIVEVVGGGGGGGGVTTGDPGYSSGGGGGGGGYARKLLRAYELPATCTVTVGGGGTGGNAAAGGTGGTSSFAGTGITTVQATGGEGGGRGALRTTAPVFEGVVDGGVGSNGDINVEGGHGHYGVADSLGMSGAGGHSVLGGTTAGVRISANGSTVGNPGNPYGSGGSGAVLRNSTTNRAGGTGGDGVVIVTEFFIP